MKTICKNVFTFDELSETAQKTAIDLNRYRLTYDGDGTDEDRADFYSNDNVAELLTAFGWTFNGDGSPTD